MNNLSDEYYSPIHKAGQLLKIIIANTPFFQSVAPSICRHPSQPPAGLSAGAEPRGDGAHPEHLSLPLPHSCMASRSARAEPASKSPAQS